MVNRRFNNAVLLFAKEPDGKSAKTRIAAKVGSDRASNIYEELLEITSRILKDSEYYVSYYSAGEPIKLRRIFNNAISFFPQVEGDLGQRMRTSFEKLFKLGYDSVTAIGTDCPYLSLSDIILAAEYLAKDNRVVIGPANDGGYFLIGCKEGTMSVLDAKKWSTSELFEETLSIINKKGYNLLKLDQKDDIDEIEDYLKFKEVESAGTDNY